jgi:hypothetical protein
MPLLDREVLDLLRGDPELLALADAIASTQAEEGVQLSDCALRRWLRGSTTGCALRKAALRGHRGSS